MNERSHVFQSFWFGETITPYEKVCLRSFVDHGHSFHLYTYSSELEVPIGVELRDAAQIIGQSEYFTYKKGRGAGSHSAFSNLFRYKLLAERGGWWVDTDVVCLTADVPLFDEFFAYESEGIVNGAVLLCRPGDPLMLDCLKETLRIRDDAGWGEIGPRLLTRMLKENGRIAGAQPMSACYPIHHREALDLLRPAKREALAKRIQSSLFLHLWNEVFRRVSIGKRMLPPRGSLLREVADRHPVEGWCGEYDVTVLEQALALENELKRLRTKMDQPIKAAEHSTAKGPRWLMPLRIFGG